MGGYRGRWMGVGVGGWVGVGVDGWVGRCVGVGWVDRCMGGRCMGERCTLHMGSPLHVRLCGPPGGIPDCASPTRNDVIGRQIFCSANQIAVFWSRDWRLESLMRKKAVMAAAILALTSKL